MKASRAKAVLPVFLYRHGFTVEQMEVINRSFQTILDLMGPENEAGKTEYLAAQYDKYMLSVLTSSYNLAMEPTDYVDVFRMSDFLEGKAELRYPRMADSLLGALGPKMTPVKAV